MAHATEDTDIYMLIDAFIDGEATPDEARNAIRLINENPEIEAYYHSRRRMRDLLSMLSTPDEDLRH